ncbi:hypothetical protein C4D60_Mb04t02330 [Musa balbisiana]|uniref:Uncharacterized protein n=1 Tax=Musa balbisiana TaxID=52838 RepID=A0A4S8K963_MUSBA|nr:hypothetical protein C4D60_Mb04t02330 [Musa balbisiana]
MTTTKTDRLEVKQEFQKLSLLSSSFVLLLLAASKSTSAAFDFPHAQFITCGACNSESMGDIDILEGSATCQMKKQLNSLSLRNS